MGDKSKSSMSDITISAEEAEKHKIQNPMLTQIPTYLVKILRLRPDAVVPVQGTPSSAGYDLVAAENMTIHVGEIVKIPLGFCTELHPEIHCRIESRSGMALKGLVVLTGVIDSDYRGEWHVIMCNFGKEVQWVAKGDRVAQAVLRPNVRAHWERVSELSDTSRGAGGFGSTGR
jgi:dUTP pyrophosphatase